MRGGRRSEWRRFHRRGADGSRDPGRAGGVGVAGRCWRGAGDRRGCVTLGNSVTSIGDYAFHSCTSLTSVTIPASVTYIGDAFAQCTSLGAITVDALNSDYSSVDGVLFNKSQTVLIKCPEGKARNYTIPNSVTSIGGYAFFSCTSLTGVYFQGNAPSLDEFIGKGVFTRSATVYYLPGTTGWETEFL